MKSLPAFVVLDTIMPTLQAVEALDPIVYYDAWVLEGAVLIKGYHNETFRTLGFVITAKRITKGSWEDEFKQTFERLHCALTKAPWPAYYDGPPKEGESFPELLGSANPEAHNYAAGLPPQYR